MTYDLNIKQPIQMIELNQKMRYDNNPYLKYALDRSVNHTLIMKQSKALFN